MAPMLLDPPFPEDIRAKSTPLCSDPSVVPSAKASKRTKELWWLHGNPHSRRYSNPKLVSLAALVRHDGLVYREQKAFLYPLSADQTTSYGSMTWEEFDLVTESIAFTYSHQLHGELEGANASRKQPTIALIGAGKTLEYFCTELALQKLGVRVLLIAESNTLEAIHHLLDSCEALAVITDAKSRNTNTNGIRKLDMIEDLDAASSVKYTEFDYAKFQDVGDVWERHSFVIHSSGSTGMPKPIIHTNRSMMLVARMYRLFQEFDVENWFLLFPLYHIAGISIALSGLPNGQILSFPPLSWPPSSSAIFTAWKTLSSMGHPVECVHCAPTLIENMCEYISDNGGDFTPLVSLKLLQPGGAALSEGIVQSLTANGVNVKTTYGSTEIGPPLRSIPHTRENPRCYTFRNLYPDNRFLKMEQVGEGLYECVVYKGFELAAELWEGKPDDEPYRTNDLFIQDPPRSGFFVLQGRKDDILVHSNGENTSAGPLQLDIQTSSKIINRALALGHSKPCVSLLVELHEAYDPESESSRNQVWEAVKRTNERYPRHSQVMESMVFILPRGSILPVTPKGNVKRKEAEKIYAPIIERVYSFSPDSTSTSSARPLPEFIRNLFSTLSGKPTIEIKDRTTIYDLGIDSRLALSLRASLSKHLRKPISLSTIFENPSISSLTSVLNTTLSTSATTIHQESRPSSTETVNKIISSLEAEFQSWPTHSTTNSHPASKQGEVILLTGASGTLGTSLLQTLSHSPLVSKVYALVRSTPSLSPIQNLSTSLSSRSISPHILSTQNALSEPKIVVLNYSMPDPLLGLDIDTYTRLSHSVTIVLHNAWKMDFNVPLPSFVPDCLRSVMSLLRFCLAGRPKTFAFTSSVATCLGSSSQTTFHDSGERGVLVGEEKIGSDPRASLQNGYALSKYVVERITQTAQRELGIKVRMLRVGQLCGDRATGRWSEREMWPIMFASSAHPLMNSLPVFRNSERGIDWIPVDVAAAAIVDILLPEEAGMAQEKGAGYEVHNVVNPCPITWAHLIGILQNSTPRLSSSLKQGTKIEEIPLGEWVSRLSALADQGVSPTEVPGLKLLRFFEEMAEEETREGNKGNRVFDTQKSRNISKALRECSAFCQEWVDGNVRVWRESGFLK